MNARLTINQNYKMDKSTFSGDIDAKMTNSHRKRGNWVTFPFIIGNMAGLTLSASGWVSNLIIYLIEEFNMKRIDAAQVYNVVNGCSSLFPIVGAIIADSFLGSYLVILISSFVSLLGTILLALTALVRTLRPPECEMVSTQCTSPTRLQFAILYTAIALACIGLGGTRFTIATMGANQYENPQDQDVFFNWYFFTMYFSSIIGATAVVYIEDNVSWRLGFGLCIAFNFIGLAVFFGGNPFYYHDKPHGSPFTGLARVLIASVRKRKAVVASSSEDYYHEQHGIGKQVNSPLPKNSFGFFNRAAIITQGDLNQDRSIAKPWRLCTIQQVEDFKALLRIFPLWSTSIFLSTPIGIQASLIVLQALTMERSLGSHFKIPAGSMLVIALLSTSVTLTIIDRLLCPLWQKITRLVATPLQRIGLGHVLNIISMAISALVESRRLKIAHDHNNSHVVPMSTLWLFPQLMIVGIGEAFHFPGQITLYYQEFPSSLRSTATAMISLLVAVGFYLSTAVIDLVRRVTGWLPDDINQGRLDNIYWMLVIVGVLNFGYYLVCAKLYKYQNVENVEGDSSSGLDK